MRVPGPPSFTSFPEGFETLADLAFDLRSAWNHRADALWQYLEPATWQETGNPWLVLQTASNARVAELWATPALRGLAERLRDDRRGEDEGPSWFSDRREKLGAVAFFSMEFALSEALPLYSGGLGNVSGDYLKAAHDLGVPLVGVGLLYQQGYFRQAIDADGRQKEFFPFQTPSQMPVVPVRDAQGEWARIRLPRPGQPVWLRTWGARVGRVALYLLDSNDPENAPADRGITAQLYGGGPETRLLQEMTLGIGGWRMLRALGLRPEVCHLNEGHAAFAALERAREFMQETGTTFDVALCATRAGNVFTTHTPVEAGFDRFSPELVSALLGAYARDLGLSVRDLIALGRARPDDDGEPLSMAWLAARASGAINAVSRRHGEVSRKIFQALWPRWPEAEVPVSHVTNGVHAASWDSAAADALWTGCCGPARFTGDPAVPSAIARCTDEQLWAFRAEARRELVVFARQRLALQLASAGLTGAHAEVAPAVLDVDALTIGMARRFTAYKRPTLLLHDAERLARLLKNASRPVQIIIAGKAHPRDDEGKELVHEWTRFVRRSDIRPHAVFLADYDMRLAEQLVRGVDLWINVPRPPWEACGTSGMKVLVNGGLNLSALDGWWAEAYRPDVGWALEDFGADDGRSAERLYDLLEREVVPSFYDRDAAGLPRTWLARMRESMSTLTLTFSADRAVREYTERYYLPATASYAARADRQGARAADLVAVERMLRTHWPSLRFGEVRVRTEGGVHSFAAPVYLDDIDESAVAVELYADDDGHGVVRVPMRRDATLVGAHGAVFVADVPATRPPEHFTARIVPRSAAGAVPLELPLVLWSK
jgi:starch phosphorylase